MIHSRKKMTSPFYKQSEKGVRYAIRFAQENLKEAVSVAITNGDHILIGRRKDTLLWTLPGGHKKDNESTYQAAVRELHEETGMRVEDLKNLGSCLCDNGVHLHCFQHELGSIVPGMRDIETKYDPDMEVESWEWVDTRSDRFQEILKSLQHPKNKTLEYLRLL